MKSKGFRLLTMFLLLVLLVGSLSVTAFATGDDPSGDSEISEPEHNDNMLTPDGNMTIVDDIHGDAGKQFITVKSKGGHYFYIIIDRATSGENTVHFLNQVDEADLLDLIDGEQLPTTPIVCSCTEKCTAGNINTSCELCMTSMTKCVGKETKPTTAEPAQQKDNSAGSTLFMLVLFLAAGGGAGYYFVVVKPKQKKNVPSDLDDFDLDDEEYLNEDEE